VRFFRPLVLFAGVFAFILLLITVNSNDPMQAIGAFFIGPWNGVWFFGNTLDGIGLLLTASLGLVFAFQAGCFNLGAEGQIYAGGLAGSIVLLYLPFDFCTTFVAAFAALFAGGLLGLVIGVLKKKAGANEIITSFLVSASLTPLADYLITGPLRDQTGNLLAMQPFPVQRLIPRILLPSNLSLSFVFALFLVAAGHIFINKTKYGYRLKIAGTAPRFARYAGIDTEKIWVPAMALSGSLAGLAGFFAAAGTYGRCHVGFSGGLGWNAIAVALIAGNKPLVLIPVALVYGALESGADAAMLATGLQVETSAFLQAAVLLFATVQVITIRTGGYNRTAVVTENRRLK
jgi:simple sugar transport system permease protein